VSDPARTPGPDARSPRGFIWRNRGPLILAAVATLIVLAALLTPEQQQARSGDQRLTSRSTGTNGAGLFYDLAGRLGWRVSRRVADTLGATGPRAIHAVLWPAADVRMTEAHALLEHVRQGGALLLVIGEGGALEDSLHVAHGAGGTGALGPGSGLDVSIDPDDETEHTGDCEAVPADRTAGLPMWPSQQMLLYSLVWRRAPPPNRVTFMTTAQRALGTSRGAPRIEPAAVGFPYGLGRIVVISDPDLLRNDVLRRCGWRADVVAIRMLEYLSAGAVDGVRRDRLVFDEYHQGFGDQPGTLRAIGRYLATTPSGHTVLQLGLAGLVLLAALAPRLLPPRDPERIERRSPLEHVDALARAYQRVGATRTATAQLLHGVRRRTERLSRGAGADRSNDLFLDWAARRVPDRAEDIALIRRVLAATTGVPSAMSGASLTLVGDALQRLERSLLTSRQ
jgi:uncharacterized protein DUF4350